MECGEWWLIYFKRFQPPGSIYRMRKCSIVLRRYFKRKAIKNKMKIYWRSLPITTLAIFKRAYNYSYTSLKNCVNKKVKCCRCFFLKDLRWFFEHILGWTGKVIQWTCTLRTITIYGTSNCSNNSTIICNVDTLLPLIIYSNNSNYYNDKLNQNDS